MTLLQELVSESIQSDIPLCCPHIQYPATQQDHEMFVAMRHDRHPIRIVQSIWYPSQTHNELQFLKSADRYQTNSWGQPADGQQVPPFSEQCLP